MNVDRRSSSKAKTPSSGQETVPNSAPESSRSAPGIIQPWAQAHLDEIEKQAKTDPEGAARNREYILAHAHEEMAPWVARVEAFRKQLHAENERRARERAVPGYIKRAIEARKKRGIHVQAGTMVRPTSAEASAEDAKFAENCKALGISEADAEKFTKALRS
jgi:hypothetical protein